MGGKNNILLILGKPLAIVSAFQIQVSCNISYYGVHKLV